MYQARLESCWHEQFGSIFFKGIDSNALWKQQNNFAASTALMSASKHEHSFTLAAMN